MSPSLSDSCPCLDEIRVLFLFQRSLFSFSLFFLLLSSLSSLTSLFSLSCVFNFFFLSFSQLELLPSKAEPPWTISISTPPPPPSRWESQGQTLFSQALSIFLLVIFFFFFFGCLFDQQVWELKNKIFYLGLVC